MPWRLLKAPTRGRLAIVDDDFLIINRKDFNQAFDCKVAIKINHLAASASMLTK